MLTISIGGVERKFPSLSVLDESWMAQELARRRGDGQSLCIRVHLEASGVNSVFSSGPCGGSGGRTRPPNPTEARLHSLWDAETGEFTVLPPGKLIAILKQMRRLLN